MTDRKAGFYWHMRCRHLCEWCYDLNEQVRAIQLVTRHAAEYEIRFRLFKPVQGELPQEVREAGLACDKAYVASREAYAVAEEVRQAVDKVWRDTRTLSDTTVRDRLWTAFLDAHVIQGQAEMILEETYKKHLPAIEALHATECGCTEIVFPEGKEET